MSEQSDRDRIRALVRDVLNRVAETEVQSSQITEQDPQPHSRFIDTISDATVSPTSVTRDESSKMVITEDDVRGLEPGAVLRIAEGARLTPLAADIVNEKRIELVRRTSRRRANQSMLVAIGADHGGYRMKEDLKQFLKELSHRVHDFGTDSEEAVDYPDFAHAVARAVAEGTADVGIIIDGAGVGSAMTANKVPGVRAAACYSVAVARNSREHNDANVLTLGSKTINTAEMKEIVGAWLATEIKEDRHRKRVAKISSIEHQYTHQANSRKESN